MTPIDPTNTVPPAPRSSTAPPYVDEDPNIDLVQRGIDVAEDETRDAVADAYEAGARESGDSPEAMDDIDFTEGEGQHKSQFATGRGFQLAGGTDRHS